jgi:hypothetical protein
VSLLLERLAPTERAAYILREAFDYPYDEIGEILKVSEANARQLVTRASERGAGSARGSFLRLTLSPIRMAGAWCVRPEAFYLLPATSRTAYQRNCTRP